MTFENVTLEQFKKAVAEFGIAADSGTLDDEQLDNGLKAVHLLYFGLPTPEEDPLTNLLAVGFLRFAQQRHMRALFGDPMADLMKLLTGA
jgi:hypothetical protein